MIKRNGPHYYNEGLHLFMHLGSVEGVKRINNVKLGSFSQFQQGGGGGSFQSSCSSSSLSLSRSFNEGGCSLGKRKENFMLMQSPSEELSSQSQSFDNELHQQLARKWAHYHSPKQKKGSSFSLCKDFTPIRKQSPSIETSRDLVSSTPPQNNLERITLKCQIQNRLKEKEVEAIVDVEESILHNPKFVKTKEVPISHPITQPFLFTPNTMTISFGKEEIEPILNDKSLITSLIENDNTRESIHSEISSVASSMSSQDEQTPTNFKWFKRKNPKTSSQENSVDKSNGIIEENKKQNRHSTISNFVSALYNL